MACRWRVLWQWRMKLNEAKPSPRRNRVTPNGDIVAISARGTMMGNRGCLTDETGRIVRNWKLKRWICCTLEERDGQRVRLDDPFGYTPLFFTDEAVALAAGHRPCGHCRQEEFYQFMAIWKRLNGISKYERVTAHQMDQDLHRRRMQRDLFSKPAEIGHLPDGCFVNVPPLTRHPALIWRGFIWPWESGHYLPAIAPIEALRTAKALPMYGVEFLGAGQVLALNIGD